MADSHLKYGKGVYWKVEDGRAECQLCKEDIAANSTRQVIHILGEVYLDAKGIPYKDAKSCKSPLALTLREEYSQEISGYPGTQQDVSASSSKRGRPLQHHLGARPAGLNGP